MLDQEGHVLPPRAERLHVDRHHVQSVEEILPEPSGLDFLGEILVRGGDDPRVHLDRAGAAQTLDLTCLDRAKKLGLRLQAHIADLVQKEGAAIGGLEASALHLCRPGEGPLLVPEELALDQILG